MSAPKPLDPLAAADLVASERWQNKVRVTEHGCWLWTASVNKGYGQVRLGGHMVLAHRIALAAALGRDLLPGLVVDHLCRNRACVRADHLREVTNRENLLAPGSEALAADQAARTHCPRGHPLAGENLIPSHLVHGKRVCLTCNLDLCRERDAAVREARLGLGLKYREYVAIFGWSRTAARRIVDSLERGVRPAVLIDGAQAAMAGGW